MEIPFFSACIPNLSTAQMREVDRMMVDEFNIELIQMMENAGRNLARLAQYRFLSKNTNKKTVIILAGSGGNGGGALVCARHLSIIGVEVKVAISKQITGFSSLAAHQLDILEKMGIHYFVADEIEVYRAPELIVDGVIGYSLKNNPHGIAAKMIDWANSKTSPILSLDVPSGLDSTTGRSLKPHISATATMTLALPKTGLLDSDSTDIVGELYLANISVPPALYRLLDPPIEVENLFKRGDIVRIK